MKTLTITPRLIKKINSLPINVQLTNGWFNKATVETVWYGFALRVEVNVGNRLAAPVFHEGWKDRSFMVWYKAGIVEQIPPALKELEARMVAAATMTDDQAREVVARGVEAIEIFRREFCIG